MDFATYITQLKAMFIALFPVVSSEEWTGWQVTTGEDENGETVVLSDPQRDLNVLLHSMDRMFNDKLRPTYDRTIWNGHKSGKVPTSLEPVRKATVKADSDKTVPTTEELADSLIG